MAKVKVTNDLINAVVLNWCSKNLKKYNDKYIIEILDFTGFTLTEEECDEIYSHIETGTAVDFVRGWFVDAKGYEVGKKAQREVAKQIQEFFNVHVLRVSKYNRDNKVFNAILYWLGHAVEMAMPEEAIIESVKDYIEEHYI